MSINANFPASNKGWHTGENRPMTEREAVIEIMMRLLGQSLKLVRAFIEPSTILIHVRMFFSSTRKPKIFVLKPDAHVKKVQIQFYRPSENINFVTQSLSRSVFEPCNKLWLCQEFASTHRWL